MINKIFYVFGFCFICTKSLKPDVYFPLKAHLDLDQSHLAAYWMVQL